MRNFQEGLSSLHKRACRCLDLISEKGLSVMANDGSQTLPKQKGARALATADRAVRLSNGQIVWLRDNARREDLTQEYKGVEVFNETPQTDKAIIAAVTALEAKRVDDERLEKAVLLYWLRAEMPMEASPSSEAPENFVRPIAHELKGWARRMREAAQSDPVGLPRMSGRFPLTPPLPPLV